MVEGERQPCVEGVKSDGSCDAHRAAHAGPPDPPLHDAVQPQREELARCCCLLLPALLLQPRPGVQGISEEQSPPPQVRPASIVAVSTAGDGVVGPEVNGGGEDDVAVVEHRLLVHATVVDLRG